MSQKYYTQTGEYIKNPKGYARTGAPMYESQSIYDTNDINKETFIYKLDLEDGKIYIGKTGNVQKRMKQHFSGDGARVTKKFKPIKCKVLDSCPGFLANEIEQLYTNKYIVEYGYNNVRGGKYTNSTSLHRTKINEETRKYMESNTKIIHFDENYVPQDQVETKNEEEWLYEEIF
tara:strand:+ start:75 stop:599 length:525 start_codon:yes stop_codon:yes gene_type:complete